MQLSDTQRRHALRFVTSVTGLRGPECGEELLARVFRQISRAEEVENQSRDGLGHWEYNCSEAHRQGLESLPRLDRELAALPGERTEPLWPDGKPFALCLTHDADMVSAKNQFAKFFRRLGRAVYGRGSRAKALLGAAGSVYRLTCDSRKPDAFGRFEDWLKLEDRCGFRSTFLFAAQHVKPVHVRDCEYRYQDEVVFDGTAMTVAEMLREIDRAGWEIGLHGSFESARTPGMLEAQKRQLEEAVGGVVSSTRQHFLQYDAAITPNLQAKAGLAADSTEGFNNSIGFRAETSFPYRRWSFAANAELDLLEIPMHIMDTPLFRVPAGSISEEKAVSDCLKLMDEVQAVGGCLTLNWHAHAIAEPILLNTYKALLEEAHSRGAWGCGMRDLREWWTAREKRLHE